MPLSFLALPFEIRDQIYWNLLVAPSYIHLCPGAKWGNQRPCRTDTGEPLDLCPAILRTNRFICDEATPILYARNAFVMATLDPRSFGLADTRVAEGFLSSIGPKNAALIRHVSIPFPIFGNYHAGRVTLGNLSEEVIGLLRDSCPSLVQLETEAGVNLNTIEILFDWRGYQIASEAAAAMNASFRTISSLEKIVVNIFPVLDHPTCNPVIIEKMRDQGWEVCVVPSDGKALRHGRMPDARV